MVHSNPIYVGTVIHTDMDKLWDYTQDPNIHQQWDLRFSKIDYLPKKGDNDPQRFLYETNIGFGLRIAGEGESVKTVYTDGGERVSSLKF